MIPMPSMWAAFKDAADNHVFNLVGEGFPKSGTSGTGINAAGFGSIYTDLNTGVRFINEGDAVTPYWTPLDMESSGLLRWKSRFKDGVGKAVADTAAVAVLSSSGLRVFGQGIAETDSGLVATTPEGGPIATITTTDEAAHLAAVSVGTTASVPFQPNTNGLMVLDTILAMSSAITERALFVGFLGTLADALDPAVTGSTTTITLVQDDLAGLYFDSGLTDADRLYAPSNKGNAAASQTTASCDTETDFPAAGTYVRLRVQIDETGKMTCFVNKAQVFELEDALDVDEEIGPVVYVESNAAAVKTMLMKYFDFWTGAINS